jgi:hypothetical protein
LWKVTRSTRPARFSLPVDANDAPGGDCSTVASL